LLSRNVYKHACKKNAGCSIRKGVEATIWAVGDAESIDEVKKADIILLGPQVRYLEKKMNERVKNEKPVLVIDMMAYGTMNGAKVLDQALGKLNG